jgi:ATP-binding cassette subfamily B protein
VLASFRWYIGLLFLAGWSGLRPPLRRLLAERANLVRRAAPELRHSWYYLGCSYRPAFAKEMRVFGLGAWILDRHRGTWLAGMAASWRQMRRFRNRTMLLGTGVAAMYLAGTGLLALAAYQHAVALGTVAVMLPMLPATMQAGGVSAADVTLEQMLAAVPDLDDLVARLRPAPAADRQGPDGRRATSRRPDGRIRFESVGYRYPGGAQPVFDGLDLELAAGRSLALVGVNGAGKTTLVTLLARLREPSAGRITIDGVDLRDLDARDWQRQVAVVNQDFGRYPLTVRENVAFCDLAADGLGGGFDAAALARAAARAGVRDFVATLPHGWDTVCSPGYRSGTDLSGGQWQRVALARALYAAERGARVLVLDEPTAHLDIRAEAAFYDQFLELTSGLTTMVISHRFATVRRAERIAVLDSGRITELGRHSELVAAGGRYAEMFAVQAARYAQARNG